MLFFSFITYIFTYLYVSENDDSKAYKRKKRTKVI